MKNLFFVKRATGILLACALIATASNTAFAFSKDGSDIDIITNTGISLKVPSVLNITSPTSNITTSYSSYTVTGTSNPNLPLYINGGEITNRGKYGSFAVTFNLEVGKNQIEVTQGGVSKSVYITRSNSSSYTVATKVTSAFPTVTQVARSGKTMKITCVAPAGSSVYATYMGTKVQLKQNVSSASKGIAANFSAEVIVPDSDANTVSNHGKITYTLINDGVTTTYNSAGDLLVAGKAANIIAQNKQSATAVYEESNTNSNIISTLRYGTVEKIIDQNDDMYQLTMGGWVKKNMIEPLEGRWRFKNEVSSVTVKSDSNGEAYTLNGNAYPSFEVFESNSVFQITLYNTTGITSIPTENSFAFTNAIIKEEGGNTVLTFNKKTQSKLWGYGVEYNKNETVIYFKRTPKLSSDANKPLSGITVALDPGHGGYDPGALGTAKETGPSEKDLTLATSIAVKNRLEALGATVLMTRTTGDENPTFNQRMFTSMNKRADFFVSIHYNSSVGTTSKGTEVYYFEENSKQFASNVQSALVSNTGRYDRGFKSTPFRVVLNTYCPSVLCEIAFLSNPVEYDSSCNRTNLYNVANSIAEGIIASI